MFRTAIKKNTIDEKLKEVEQLNNKIDDIFKKARKNPTYENYNTLSANMVILKQNDWQPLIDDLESAAYWNNWEKKHDAETLKKIQILKIKLNIAETSMNKFNSRFEELQVLNSKRGKLAKVGLNTRLLQETANKEVDTSSLTVTQTIGYCFYNFFSCFTSPDERHENESGNREEINIKL